jgi:hypothetical protein
MVSTLPDTLSGSSKGFGMATAYVFLGIAVSPLIFLVGFLAGVACVRAAAVVERKREVAAALDAERRRFWHCSGSGALN